MENYQSQTFHLCTFKPIDLVAFTVLLCNICSTLECCQDNSLTKHTANIFKANRWPELRELTQKAYMQPSKPFSYCGFINIAEMPGGRKFLWLKKRLRTRRPGSTLPQVQYSAMVCLKATSLDTLQRVSLLLNTLIAYIKKHDWALCKLSTLRSLNVTPSAKLNY